MAKKRNLKRAINYACSDLFAETMAAVLYGGKDNKSAADNLLASILIMRNDFVSRISHPEPGIKARKYYQELIKNFNESVSDIIDKIKYIG